MNSNRKILCGAAALVVSAGFFGAAFLIPGLSDHINRLGNGNLLVYGAMLLLFCLVFLGGMLLTERWEPGTWMRRKNKKVNKLVFTVLIFSQMIFYAIGVSMETGQVGSVSEKYGWHTQPLPLMSLLFLAELVVFFRVYANIQIREEKNDWMVWLIYAVLTILIFYCMDTPNIFGRAEAGDHFHAHAYYNSVYNVYQGLPYTDTMTSIYGHYGLLFKIPMKLVGGDFRMFVLMIAALGTLAHVCAFLVLELTVESRILRALGAVAAAFPVLGMRGGYYWQVWPHRMIFPMILLLYAAILMKKQWWNRRTGLAGYLICLLAILWNTETGVILAVAWMALYISRCLAGGEWRIGRLTRTVPVHAVCVTASFFGAYGLVNLYNLSKHSPANTLGEFLIPLLSDSYMVDILHLDLPMYPSAYMGVIVLFLIGTVMGISTWFYPKQKNEGQVQLLFFLSISALGRMTYYVNRPSYHNLDCVSLSAVILLAYLGQRGMTFVKERKWKHWEEMDLAGVVNGTLGLACAAAVLAMSTGTVLQFSQNSKIKENYHNVGELEAFVQEIAEVVPENTHGFGLNVAEIYSLLHWNTQCFTMDFSDMAVIPESLQELQEQLTEADAPYVFTSRSSLPIWERNDPETYQWFSETYELDQTFPYYEEEFQFYRKK